MKLYRIPLIFLLSITLCVTLVMPPRVALGASPLETLTQSIAPSTGGSSFNLFNALLGLLLGNLLGKTTPAPTPQMTNPSTLASSTDTKSATTKGNNLIATAKTLLGTPYVWGGETTAGFDCSSFTQYVMKQNGIAIPRTAAEQYAVGTAVSRENLQVGDLVFFTTYKPGASHVGFYMGNNQFIHDSSAAKQVTINSLTETYYTDHYIGARRYIK